MSENMTYKNMWDTAKVNLTMKLRTLKSYIRKEQRFYNNPTSYLKKLEKVDQNRTKISKRKKVRAEINKIENKKENINETKR